MLDLEATWDKNGELYQNGTSGPFSRAAQFDTLSFAMMSVFILLFAVFALAKLGIAQWRAIWITMANRTLSDSFELTAGIDPHAIGAQHFASILHLGEQICPGLKKASPWLAEVSVYYRVIRLLDETFHGKLAPISNWANREMQMCSRYAAVLLDQSLAINLDRQVAARAN